MFWVISYDIVDNRRRYRLAKALKNFGYRVQKSVFECQVDDRQFLKMKKQVEKIINREEDSVRYYFICARCKNQIEVSGQGSVREEDDLIIA